MSSIAGTSAYRSSFDKPSLLSETHTWTTPVFAVARGKLQTIARSMTIDFDGQTRPP